MADVAVIVGLGGRLQSGEGTGGGDEPQAAGGGLPHQRTVVPGEGLCHGLHGAQGV